MTLLGAKKSTKTPMRYKEVLQNRKSYNSGDADTSHMWHIDLAALRLKP